VRFSWFTNTFSWLAYIVVLSADSFLGEHTFFLGWRAVLRSWQTVFSGWKIVFVRWQTGLLLSAYSFSCLADSISC